MLFKSDKNIGKMIPQNYIYSKVKKRKVRLVLVVFYSILALIAFFSVFYFLFFSDYFKVKNISFSGMETMKEADLKDIYQKYSGEKAGIFFDRKNIFVFSSDDLSGLFKRSLRRVEDASVKRDFPSSLSVVVKEYSPLGIACENFMPESGSKCFYFNENGVIFDVSPAIISELFVFVKDKNLNIGNFPFQKYSKEQVDFILAFKRYLLEESGALVDHFEFKDQFKDIEVFLRSGARIFLTEDQSPKDQARATAEILKNKIKGDLSSLDYIDLRIKNKAYYKLKQNAGYKTGTSTEPDLQ